MSNDLAKLMPQDSEAEKSCLGSMLLHWEAIAEVLKVIPRDKARWFYWPEHAPIFELIVEMFERDSVIDMRTVAAELDRQPEFRDRIKGVDFLVELAESVPSHLHAAHYARIVRDKGMIRDVIKLCGDLTADAYGAKCESDPLISKAELLISELSSHRAVRQATPIGDHIDKALATIEARRQGETSGVATGLVELDGLLCGLQPADMLVVAGRPGSGKTSLGMNLAERIALCGLAVVFFSMEMSKDSVVMRTICSLARVDSHKIRRGYLSREEANALHVAGEKLRPAPLFIDDTSSLSPFDIRTKVRQLRRKHDIAVVFIDYIQLMSIPGHRRSRQEEVSEISRLIKAMAKSEDLPVIAMCQLNRQGENRADKRPMMSEIRESGAIEQDADVVMLLYREEYYKKDNCPEELRGIAELIIDKNRSGPTGKITLQFDKRCTRFENLMYTHNEPAYRNPSEPRESKLFDPKVDDGAPF